MVAMYQLLPLVFVSTLILVVTWIVLPTREGVEIGEGKTDPGLSDGLVAWQQVYSV